MNFARIKTLAAVAVLSIATVGCAVTGRAFDRQAVDSFVPGQTTMAEAVEKIGKPQAQQTQDGITRAKWSHVVANPMGARSDMLMLEFDREGKFTKIVREGSSSTR